MNLDTDLIFFTKFNSVTHGPKYKMPDYKTLEDNTGENLDDFGIHDDFLDTNQKHDPWKKCISKLDFLILKTFPCKKIVKNGNKNHRLAENLFKTHKWQKTGS